MASNDAYSVPGYYTKNRLQCNKYLNAVQTTDRIRNIIEILLILGYVVKLKAWFSLNPVTLDSSSSIICPLKTTLSQASISASPGSLLLLLTSLLLGF